MSTFFQETPKTLKLAGPIILGEMVQMSLHLIDTAMIGSVDYKQLAAASLVYSIINIPFVLGIGLTIAISQLVSLANGSRNDGQVAHYFFNGMIVCFISSILISLILFFSTGIVFHIGQDYEVALHSVSFMKITAVSIIPMILFIALKQFTDGLEYTKTAMMLSFIGIPINVFFNWLLIFGNWGFPRLELDGAAYGTLITRILMLVALAFIIFRHRTFRRFMAHRKKWFLSYQTARKVLGIGIPSALQISMEAGAFAVSGIIVGMVGAAEQAAHQIALSIASFTFMVSWGFAQAASIRTSNALGSHDWIKIKGISHSTLVVAMAYGIFCALIYSIFKGELPLIFNNEKEVVSLAGILLVFAAIFQIPDALQVNSAALLRGIKDVKIPTYLIGISYWFLGIPIGLYLCFSLGMGAKGIWIGLIIGLAVVSILLTWRLLKKIKSQNVG